MDINQNNILVGYHFIFKGKNIYRSFKHVGVTLLGLCVEVEIKWWRNPAEKGYDKLGVTSTIHTA